MDVLITFDVEIWCNSWEELDDRFPDAYQRYVYGSSRKGNFALPHILGTLNRYGLKGVFFVEPMFNGSMLILAVGLAVQATQRRQRRGVLAENAEAAGTTAAPVVE